MVFSTPQESLDRLLQGATVSSTGPSGDFPEPQCSRAALLSSYLRGVCPGQGTLSGPTMAQADSGLVSFMTRAARPLEEEARHQGAPWPTQAPQPGTQRSATPSSASSLGTRFLTL